MTLMRARDLIGRPVVSIASGDDVAEVRDVVYDRDGHRMLGFTLNKRGVLGGRLKSVLPAAAIASIGPDAVMIEDESAIDEQGDHTTNLGVPGSARPVIGNRVLSADGTDLGEITAVIMSTGTEPSAVGYEVQARGRSDSSFVPISAQMALSGDNLVVPAEAGPFIRDDLVGFGAAVESYRASALENDDQ